MKVKKIKLEAMSNYHASNNQHGADSENGDMNSSVGKFYVHGNFCDHVATKLLFFPEQNYSFLASNTGYILEIRFCPSNNMHSD